jgi:ATP-dependent protease ClpP protease subunit
MNNKLIQAVESNAPFWEIKNKTETSADLYIYSTISRYGADWGDLSSMDVIKAVKELGKISRLNVHINSPGGSVSEGLAIKAFLAQQSFKKTVYIDSLCASVATVIAFGIGADVHMEDTALVMIHHAWTYASGNAGLLRKAAEMLDKHDEQLKKVYIERTNGTISEKDIISMMDEEYWMDADECLEKGFIDFIEKSAQATACLPEAFYDAYNNVPDSVVKIPNKSPNVTDSGLDAESQAIITQANAVLEEYRRRKENII